ncbi:Hypothetical predicted protein [Mytilus galloprovincialis]|uniref:Cadherin domain-containing protein n=2 Tax=Mytilus galloprovincialis TaxID=29158 RepID=A0A8B6F525_MYTGA|nr:Hypothetical predicted protein [Mytilus galloprovincialis]
MMQPLILVVFSILGFKHVNACDGVKQGYNDHGNGKDIDNQLSNYGVIATDSKFTFDCCGTIRRWRATAGGPGEVDLQVWRPTGKENEFRLMGQNSLTFDKAGGVVTNIPEENRISVEKGDHMGWHTKTSGTLIFEDGGSDGNYVLQSMPGASFGAIVDWSAATRVDKRSYSIEAIGNENMPPSFKNLPHTSIISQADMYDIDQQPTEVFLIEVTDTDVHDIPGLKVEVFGFDQYFQIENTNMVVIVSAPPVDTYVLKIKVTDHCGLNKTEQLTVEIKDFGTTTKGPDEPVNTAASSGDSEDFEWDWLIGVIIATIIILVIVALLFFFRKKGWLKKAHRTAPKRKLTKDEEMDNGTKTDSNNPLTQT